MSQQLERNIIASILDKPAHFTLATAEGVVPETFADRACREIYAVCGKLELSGKSIDAVEVMERLPGLTNEIATIVSSGEIDLHFDQWIQLLRDNFHRRQIVDGLSAVLQNAELPDTAPNEILDALAAVEISVRSDMGRQGFQSTTSVCEGLAAMLAAGPLPTLPVCPAGTEIASKLLVHQGELLTLAAEPGAGKTAILIDWCCELLRAERSAVYLCTESTSSDLAGRLAGCLSGVSHYEATGPRCTPGRKKLFLAALDEVAAFRDRLQLIGCECGLIRPSVIETAVRNCKLKNGRCDAVFVDFIQGVKADNVSQRTSCLERLNSAIESIHSIGARHGTAVLIASQINRRSEADGLPSLNLLKDSSLLGQLCHTVLFLSRDKSNPKIAILESLKTRNCAPFKVVLDWNGSCYKSQPEFPTAGI